MEWDLLADVPAEDVERVLGIARRRTFAGGDVVFRQGDAADSLHLVVAGRFAARVTSPLGDTTTVALFGPGEAFGELALLSEVSTRSATVTALEAAETSSVSQRDFVVLRKEHPTVTEVLMRLLAEQLRRTNDSLVEALHVDADTRVRRRLLELADGYRRPGEDETVIPLTQEDLAGLAGTSSAIVERVLREEERRGALDLRGGRPVVLDLEGFRRRTRPGERPTRT